ncbi:protein PTHB1 [Eurytemora carolleeae]|uniref:protein PTHB1 n=1 Tax=Eurytemora carolleeae TaxID=1294199 RepID=UPI000C759BE3|nr:protein PTHB1 [Eurytemora carolleeae]|eukprot:XP_023334275.1 protein PTHB1-like [Eurytemora affinis]
MDVKIVVTFLTNNNVPQSQSYNLILPLSLVVKPCPPIKDADFKVTLSTNKPAVSLLDIFPEFVLDSSMTNAAGFQVYGGPSITVLSSKTSQRYRLQSENLPALWIISQHILHRLKQRFSDGSGRTDFECSYSSSLPLQIAITYVSRA